MKIKDSETMILDMIKRLMGVEGFTPKFAAI